MIYVYSLLILAILVYKFNGLPVYQFISLLVYHFQFTSFSLLLKIFLNLLYIILY
jgi:hypothetical protein